MTGRPPSRPPAFALLTWLLVLLPCLPGVLPPARAQEDILQDPRKTQHRCSFPLAADPDGSIDRRVATEGIPRTYVLGRDGKILFQSAGFSLGDFGRLKATLTRELMSGTKGDK